MVVNTLTKDIGSISITIGFNTIHCFGIGYEKYPLIDMKEDNLNTIVARVNRFDFLFFFINFTKYPKVAWR
jgi:hypothetical protein